MDILTGRGVTHELVRHRLFAFTQESTRFVNYEKKMPASFIDPLGPVNTIATHDIWEKAIQDAEAHYRALIGSGCAPQIARSVFPNALSSRIVVTGNLRNWRHFFLMRTTKEAHPQMREIAIPLLEEFQERIPLLYADIIPMDRQIENMRNRDNMPQPNAPGSLPMAGGRPRHQRFHGFSCSPLEFLVAHCDALRAWHRAER